MLYLYSEYLKALKTSMINNNNNNNDNSNSLNNQSNNDTNNSYDITFLLS